MTVHERKRCSITTLHRDSSRSGLQTDNNTGKRTQQQRPLAVTSDAAKQEKSTKKVEVEEGTLVALSRCVCIKTRPETKVQGTTDNGKQQPTTTTTTTTITQQEREYLLPEKQPTRHSNPPTPPSSGHPVVTCSSWERRGRPAPEGGG